MTIASNSRTLHISCSNPAETIDDNTIEVIQEYLRSMGLEGMVSEIGIDFRDYLIQHINIEGPDGQCFHQPALWASTTICDLAKKIGEVYKSENHNYFSNIDWKKDIKATMLTISGMAELVIQNNLHKLGIRDGDKIRIQHMVLSKPELIAVAEELSRWANQAGISIKKILLRLDMEMDNSKQPDWVDVVNMVHAGVSKPAGYGRLAVAAAIETLAREIPGNHTLTKLAQQVANG